MSVILETARGLVAGTTLQFKLFDAREWRVVLDTPIQNAAGQGWTGHIDGQTGRFVMQYSPDGGHFSAILRPVGEGAIEIGQCRDARCVVRQFARVVQVDCPVMRRGPVTIAKAGPAERAIETIDLLALYTRAVVKGEPGWSDPLTARTDIQAWVTDLNTTMSCSVVGLQVRLVGTEVVDFSESGDLSQDLNTSWNVPTTTAAVTLAALRQQYGADLVSIIEQTGSKHGEATPYAATAAYKDVAVNIVRYDMAAAGVFGHELGHNLGAGHEQPFGNGFEARSHGLVIKFDVSEVATVMVHQATERIGRFSNPDACFASLCTGIRGEADNAATLNATAHDVASFRAAKTPSSLTAIPCTEDRTCPQSVNSCAPITTPGLPPASGDSAGPSSHSR
jgi:hypothetical protein